MVDSGVISQELLEIIVCPETHQALKLADEELLNRLNADIKAGKIKNVDGELVSEPLEAGLRREDGKRIYPIRDGIPVLLIGEGIDL